MMNTGIRIKKVRESKGLTQEDLGRLCGTTKQTIFKYETGIITNIPIDRLEKIASALKVTPAYLMGWQDDGDILERALDSMMDEVKKAFPNDEFSQVKMAGRDQFGMPLWAIANCTTNDIQLLTAYWKLNSIGRDEAKKRISELGLIEKYASPESLKSEDEISKINQFIAPVLDNEEK